MVEQSFEKVLTANDTGLSKSHQAGIHVPKGQRDLIAFLPPLDSRTLNPSVWLTALDADGVTWKLRYIHYNNQLHVDDGTRDEYRITHLTAYLRAAGARPGDRMVISGEPGSTAIRIAVVSSDGNNSTEARTVRLRGWHRVH
jgi:hypothetical protein